MTEAAALISPPDSLSRPTALFSGMLRSCFSTNWEVTTGNLKAWMSGGLGGINGVAEGSCHARYWPMEVKYLLNVFAICSLSVIICPSVSNPLSDSLDLPGNSSFKHFHINIGLYLFSSIITV